MNKQESTATFGINSGFKQATRMVFSYCNPANGFSSMPEAILRDDHKNYDTTSRRMTGRVVKRNAKTVLVALPDGNVIKRHKIKHGVGY